MRRKRMSLKQSAFIGGLAFTLATSMLVGAALGAKRITYAEAWRLCKAELDNARVHSGGVSNERYHRGAACMHRYGHHI
jgi:hypothetical protein